jgi:hypothetical protein
MSTETSIKHISLADLNPPELKAMRNRLVTQRRQEQAFAGRIAKVLERVTARLDKHGKVAA